MRTISTAQERALSGQARAEYLRVRVDSDGLGTWVDLTDLEGVDWVISASIRVDVDNPMTTATVQLWREWEKLSLVGLMSGSKINVSSTVVDVAREIKIETAVIAYDSSPLSADWVLVFHGYIDDIDFGGDKPVMRLTCRDLGAELADTFIEAVAVRGAAGGRAVETTMQNILNAALASPPTLYVPTSPSWNILEYKQVKEPVFDAIRKLANQIGWDVRYKWRAGTAQFELTLWEPDRALAGGVLRTFDDSEYYNITQAAVSRKNIRNRVKVTYSDPTQEIRDTGGSPYRTTYIAEDAASKTKYGTRYMEVAEASTSNIDSAAEAQTMAEAIRDDLKEPTLTHVVELPYFWPVELGDYYTFAANDVHYDTDQSLAVVGIAHTLEPGKCRTVLQTRGRPSAGTKRWLEIEGRPGVGYTTDDLADAAAGNPAGEAGGPGQIIVTYDDPRVAAPPVVDWAYTECHVSTSSGFTPSNSTLKGVGRVTRFEIGNLIAGTTYYIKLIIFDDENNVASVSSQVTQAAGLVGPKQANPDGELSANIVPNPSFGVWSPPLNDKTANPPDNWTPCKESGGVFVEDAALWVSGANGVYYSTSVHKSGGHAVSISRSGSSSPVYQGIMTKDLVPVVGSQLYDVEWVLRHETSFDVYGRAEFYQEDKSTSAGVLARTGTLPSGAGAWWHELAKYETASTARYMRAMAGILSSSTSALVMYADRITARKGLDSFRAYQNAGNTTVANGAWTKVRIDTESFDYGSNFNTAAYTFTAPEDGEYQFSARAVVEDVANNSFVQLAVYINGAVYIYGDRAPNWSGAVMDLFPTIATQTINLTGLDVVDIRIYGNDAANPVTLTGSMYTSFEGRRVR